MLDKDKVVEWLKSNMQVHKDWTGSWIEYANHCESVDEFIEKLLINTEK